LLKFLLSFEAGIIMVNNSRLRPKVWMVDYGFVVNLEGKLGNKECRFLDKGGASDECSSIQEDF
jgi:hypothetical protein